MTFYQSSYVTSRGSFGKGGIRRTPTPSSSLTQDSQCRTRRRLKRVFKKLKLTCNNNKLDPPILRTVLLLPALKKNQHQSVEEIGLERARIELEPVVAILSWSRTSNWHGGVVTSLNVQNLVRNQSSALNLVGLLVGLDRKQWQGVKIGFVGLELGSHRLSPSDEAGRFLW